MNDSRNNPTGLRALILYWSATGNTEKVGRVIHHTLEEEGYHADLLTVAEADKIELYDYDLFIIGAPSYMWAPPDPVRNFIKRKMSQHDGRGDIKLQAPKLPGKYAAVFCTYSGPHTGLREAIPVGKYLGQFCEHLGFNIIGEWYVVGEFHGREDRSTCGCLGDIRGRPNEADLREVTENVSAAVSSIQIQ